MMRSLLFVPADAETRFAKALESGADAVIADLEDAVDSSRKGAARVNIKEFLTFDTPVRRYVRINGLDTDECWADIAEIIRPGLDGVVLPKFQSAEDVRRLDWILSRYERMGGLEEGAIEILPLVETAVSVANLTRLVGPLPRVKQLTFGAVDLRQDLSLRIDPEETQLAHLRWSLVVASRAAGLCAPIDTVYVGIKDSEGHADSLRRASALGFGGKLCIHPSQVAPTNSAFGPTAEDVARATAILAAYGQNRNAGALQVEGRMIDRPVIEWARSIVEGGRP